jgi:hypothetical protein
MAKSLFPQDMINSMSGELSPDIIANKLTYFHIQVQDLHWATRSHAEHEALGKLYELVFDTKDEVVEKIMGYSGVRAKSGDVKGVRPYTIGLSMQVATEIIMFAKQLQNYGSMNNMPDIENIAQSLSGETAKIKYLLTQD